MFYFIRFSALFILLLLVLAPGCRHSAEKPLIALPEVVVEEVLIRDVQPYVTTTGHTEAFEFVNVPARVSGILREIRYRPGDVVAANAPLFLIEPEQYQAAVKSAASQLASAQVQLKLSEANLLRTTELKTKGALTEQDLQTDTAKRDEAAANVLNAEAQLDIAKLNLSYTDIRSPITGKTDRNLVDLGNLVGPDKEPILTTIAGMDPIYVYFDISDYDFNNIREFAKNNDNPKVKELFDWLKKRKESLKTQSPQQQASEPQIKIVFELGLIKGALPTLGEFPFQGMIDMTSNKIDRSTGTITIRGEVPNPDYTIFPGQICRIRIPLWQKPNTVLVKTEAIRPDLNHHYVFVVDEKNVAHRRIVKLGEIQPDGTRVVEEGLQKGDRYVVLGIQKVRDGNEIAPRSAAAIK
ncbi:MAG: efflux RND transporter periplasmic adaptor subunit [Planctomycetaceae bacterium]|jgi:multidrug efflux system membrane fusion protein|nr:efflux RND transporter periplasmic adaptor subunit [Planctomycetaceae bacterium]